MVRDEELAKDLARRAHRGENFTSLVHRYTERPGYKEKDGIFYWFAEGAWGLLGERAFTLKEGEIAGPIRLGKRYSVIKMLGRRPENVLPYEEVKGRVERDLKINLRKERQTAFVMSLRNEYKPEIFEDVLAKAFIHEE